MARGHLVLKPKRHLAALDELEPGEATALGVAAHRLVGAMTRSLSPERVYMCSFGEFGSHLHFHLLPRYPNQPEVGPDLVRSMLAGAWGCTDAEAEEAAARVRIALSADLVPESSDAR
jgi:diadenosine tetraphosphate (Ap4A) HIT family hydrolase